MPNETATLTGDANLNGSLKFTLYNDATCGERWRYLSVHDDRDCDERPIRLIVQHEQHHYSGSRCCNRRQLLVAREYDDNVLSSPADSCSETTAITITN